MQTSYLRGHEICFDGMKWKYTDNNRPADDSRTCPKCGQYPTPEGYDFCLGHVDGAKSACCGHGVEKAYIIEEVE